MPFQLPVSTEASFRSPVDSTSSELIHLDGGKSWQKWILPSFDLPNKKVQGVRLECRHAPEIEQIARTKRGQRSTMAIALQGGQHHIHDG